jgi:hypothetical protein
MTGSKSCMPKMHPRPNPLAVSTRLIKKRVPPSQHLSKTNRVGLCDHSGMRLVGEPLPCGLPGDPQGDRDLVP